MNAHLRSVKAPPPPMLVALLGWLIPGAGYWMLGRGEHRRRAIVVGVTIIVLFVTGMLIGGVRVVDVPGFDRNGNEIRIDLGGHRIDLAQNPRGGDYENGSWAVTSRGFFGEIANKPWYVGQILAGPMCLVSSYGSLAAARSGIPQTHARLNEIGTLYTAVAGMLNLLVIIDAAHRASQASEQQRGEESEDGAVIITAGSRT